MKWVVGLLIIFALLGGAWFWFNHYSSFPIFNSSSSGVTPTASTTPAYEVPPLTQSYQNSAYHFSLMMPAGFSASESQDPSSGADTIALQDTSGNGIQIAVSPFSDDQGQGYTLTAERIHQDLPDLQITSEQPVVVGPNYTGLAFISDNPAFDGDSREVWFVFRGKLYQISTYERLDPLLQAIFKTWRFD